MQDQTDGAAACARDLAVQLNAGASDVFLVELVKTIRNEAKVFGPKGAYWPCEHWLRWREIQWQRWMTVFCSGTAWEAALESTNH